jgi:hypothetical protein
MREMCRREEIEMERGSRDERDGQEGRDRDGERKQR